MRKGEGGVLIESVAFPGRVLSYDGGSLCTVPASKNAKGVHWELEAANASIFYISSASGVKRISSKADCSVFSAGRRKSPWEEWKVEKTSGGFTIFSCAHRKYLTSFSSGAVATSKDAHFWDTEESARGGVHFSSREHGRALCLDKNDDICTVVGLCQSGASETWIMEASMPRALSQSQIFVMAGIGLGAIAAPFAVVGAVGALGFTASGISAGSLAASMMSAEAIAAGGGVAVAGTVATLQSVGAAGLGLAGTAAAAAGGGVLAGTVAGATGALENKGSSSVAALKEDGGAVLLPCRHRPLCAWRSW